MERYLRNCLRLPFQEPAFLRHGLSLEGACVPSFKYESKTECLKFTKLWDCRGLQSLFGAPLAPGYFCSFFLVYKNPECDRQIGDRRLPKAPEFHLDGPSKFLPPGPLLCQMHVPRHTHCGFGSVTDRRDFYHQAEVSVERAQTNLLPFHVPLALFEGSHAHGEFCARQRAAAEKRDRVSHGDRFGLKS